MSAQPRGRVAAESAAKAAVTYCNVMSYFEFFGGEDEYAIL